MFLEDYPTIYFLEKSDLFVAEAPSGFVEDHEDISRLLKPFVHTTPYHA